MNVESPFHPSLRKLISLRMRARLRRMLQTAFSPRRMGLTIITILLTLVWFGSAWINAVMREPYAPDKFRDGISLVLTAYFLWHVVRFSWKRPEQEMELTPAELFFLTSGPFSRRQIITYRLTTLLPSSLFKTTLVCVLLFPDLPVFPLGFLGFLSGMMFLEYVRVILETSSYGARNREYFIARSITFAGLVLFGFLVISGVVRNTQDGMPNQIEGFRDLAVAMWGEINELRATQSMKALEAPFTVFARLSTAPRFDLPAAGWLLAAFGMVVFAGQTALWADRYFHRRRVRDERLSFESEGAIDRQTFVEKQGTLFRLISIPHLKGVGPVCWRQFQGVRAYPMSVLVSLLIPGVMALFPLFVPNTTFLTVSVSVLFFSFVLLPSALKFDFRRDYDRLSSLKMLPLSSTSVVVGQILTPVILTFLFQVVVLSIAIAVRPYWFENLLGSLSLMLPLVVFFFALDNLIFLWFPHRVNEEGFEVFLRTILTFTAKGILFGLILGVIILWERTSVQLHLLLTWNQRGIFWVGLNTIGWLMALTTCAVLIRTFRLYDPSLERSG